MKHLKFRLPFLIATLFVFFAFSNTAKSEYSSHFYHSPVPFDQTDTTDEESEFLNWYNLYPADDEIQGIGTEKAYNELLKGKKSTTVIIGIIDSGVDVNHEDLKDKIWVNEDEIPGNGEDDDKNGYVDDVHGWNFLGNADGENVIHETLELTRLYKKYKEKFEGKDKNNIPAEQKDEFQHYLEIKEAYQEEYDELTEEYKQFKQFIETYDVATELISEHLGKEDFTEEDVKTIETEDQRLGASIQFYNYLYENNFDKKQLEDAREHYDGRMKYHYNLDYNARDIVGDNPESNKNRYYGNNDVDAPDADHGTHVAGIIGAKRNNDIGINGIAKDVEFMVLRTVPDGDERDKDVANAIRYAVDNGAQIINMSFGKAYSPQKKFVDEAVKYAEEKGVLLIHAAGNDAANNDKVMNYPTHIYKDKTEATNWITVGASARYNDIDFVGSFSNYGRKSVDIFAPGVDIYSTVPESDYAVFSGTSMAAPVVTGAAAVLKSYYPELTVFEIRDILLESATQYRRLKVYRPTEGGKKRKTKFKRLSTTGGLLNLYEAIKMAENYKK